MLNLFDRMRSYVVGQ